MAILNNTEKILLMADLIRSEETFRFNGDKVAFVGGNLHIVDEQNHVTSNFITPFIGGDCTIEKKKFKPKRSTHYYCYSKEGEVNKFIWMGSAMDYALFLSGNCFSSQQEAKIMGKKVFEEQKREYIKILEGPEWE